MTFFENVLLIATALSTIYYLWTSWLLRRWIGNCEDAGARDVQLPVTFLKPIKPGVPGLREKVELLVAASRAEDQIIFGVSDDADDAVCRSAKKQHPSRDIVVIRCNSARALNPKISKLIEMSVAAQHERWIASDSEALMTADFVEKFRATWAASRADVLSAGYRFTGGRSLPQRLDAGAALLSLWPGIAMARRIGTTNFALGACTGVFASDIESLGGWSALADFLAEDNRLGHELAARGKKICLSDAVLTLEADPLTWRGYLLHQHRVARTYRVSNAPGFFGMLITHGVTFAAILALCAPLQFWRWLIFGAVYLVRLASAKANSRVLQFPIRQLPLVVLLSSFAETIFWTLSWLPLPIVWGRVRFDVRRDGRLVR